MIKKSITVYIAIALLLLVVLSVVFNAMYVNHISSELTKMLDALPLRASGDSSQKIQDVREYFDKHYTRLGLSVNYTHLARIEELMTSLLSYSDSSDTDMYLAELALLKESVRALARNERFSMRNIF